MTILVLHLRIMLIGLRAIVFVGSVTSLGQVASCSQGMISSGREFPEGMNRKFSDAQRAAFRELLEAQLNDAQLSATAAHRNMLLISDARQDSSTDDEHDPEGVTLAYERSQESAMERLATERFAAASAALAKLDAGTYGDCQNCGQAIAVARLEARPAATLCIDCANRSGS